MTATYDVTLDDVVAFNLYHWHHSPSLRRQLFIIRISLTVVTVALCMLGISLLPGNETLSPLSFILALLAGLGIYLYYPKSADIDIRKKTAKLVREGKNHGMLGQQRITLTPELLESSSSAGDATIRWSSVERIAMTDEYAFIYVSALSALIVPSRTFADQAAYTSFIRTAQQYQQAHAEARPVAA